MLLVTTGDVYGTNCEAIARLLDGYEPQVATVIVGSQWHLQHQAQQLGLALPKFVSTDNLTAPLAPGLYSHDPLADKNLQRPADELKTKELGHLAVAALNALKQVPIHQRQAVLTGPIDKAACVAAGWTFPGQTEFFQEIWDHPACMILAGPQLKVGLATNHLSLRQVPDALNIELIQNKINLLRQSLQRYWQIDAPRIAVTGLNPHASDGGLFGDEEERIIAPALKDLAGTTGPIPADTAFYRCYQGEFDAVLAMYHDQGLGPLKTVHFDTAVNVSGGLPQLRLSPDHGPVQDRYLQADFSLRSWQEAFRIARQYGEAENGH